MEKTKAEIRVGQCLEAIRDRIPFVPRIAVVLGSGLGGLADEIEQEAVIRYEEIPDFPVSTVQGHQGRFVFGRIGDVPVVLMQGRVHYYEGYSMEDVVLPVRLMKKMGAEILVLSNASGGLHKEWGAGALMMMTDQISSFVPSPLIGPNAETFGTRFPDMSYIYDPELQEILRSTAKESGITLYEGVYLQASGPQYESPAEIRMFRILGADAVGMSTTVEAIAAVHAGMRVCGVSCICNPAAGISDRPLSHREVQEAADAAGPLFRQLIRNSIMKMA